LGSMRAPAWGDDEKPKVHRLSVPASEPIRWRNKDWPNQPESCWRVRCTCGQSFGSVQHDYAVAEARAHLVTSGAASPLSHVYHLAKQFLAGNRELTEVVFHDKPDYQLRDLFADAVAAIPQPRPAPRPELAQRREKERVKPPDRKLCNHCLEPFQPSRADQLYCSKSHRVLATMKRKRLAAERLERGEA
jgi:hypothetical protein